MRYRDRIDQIPVSKDVKGKLTQSMYRPSERLTSLGKMENFKTDQEFSHTPCMEQCLVFRVAENV